MPFISVTNTFSNGSTADATQVNQNFTDIINGLSDGTKNISISALTAAGASNFQGAVTLGASTSNLLVFNGSVNSDIPINTNTTYNLGAATKGLLSVYIGGSSTFTYRFLGGVLTGSCTYTLPPGTGVGTSRQRLETDGTGVLSWQPIRRTPSDAQNFAISATVGSNNLTLALKTLINNADASSTDPIDVVFRNSTATTGQPVVRTITAALSMVIASGTTIGTANGVASYIYIYLLDNAGTPEFAASLSSHWDEGQLQSTTAVSGGSSSTTLYSTTARTNVAIRLIGRIQISEATAGTWATAPTEVSTIPIKATRQIVFGTAQTVNGTTTSASYAAPSNTMSITFTAQRTGYYKVSTSQYIMYNSTASQSISSRLVATSGSPTTVHIAQNNIDTTASFGTALLFTYVIFGIYNLTAGTSYTFNLQCQTSGGTLTVAFGTQNSFLIAEEL